MSTQLCFPNIGISMQAAEQPKRERSETDLFALSLIRPWAWAILQPNGKRVENRMWAPDRWHVGRRFVLHSSKTFDYDAVAFIRELLPGCSDQDREHPGGFVGTARLVEIARSEFSVPPSQRCWYMGNVGWLLEDVRPFATAIPSRGDRGLWRINDAQRTLLQERCGEML